MNPFLAFRRWSTKRWLSRLRKRYYDLDQNLDHILTQIAAVEKTPGLRDTGLVAKMKLFYEQGRAHQRACLMTLFEETLLLQERGEELLEWALEQRWSARYKRWEIEVSNLNFPAAHP